MRFTIARERLLEALGAVVPATADKATSMPIITHCLVEATKDGVRWTGTDFDRRIRADVPADAGQEGVIAIPAKKLAEIAAKLPAAPVAFATKGDTRVTIECGGTRFTLVGLPASEFPSAPHIDAKKTWRVKTPDMQTLVASVAFCASTDDNRPIINGVLWELRPDLVRMVATNGHRLATMRLTATGNGAPTDMIVPPWALAQAAKLFADDGEIELARGDHHLAFRTPRATLITRLVEGPYPPYEQVIPKDNPFTATVNRAAFIAALERVALLAPKERSNRVDMAFNAALVKMTASARDVGDAAADCAIRYTGDPLDIGFDGRYLLDIVRRVPTDELKLTLHAPERAITIEPEGQADAAQMYVLMPVRVQ